MLQQQLQLRCDAVDCKCRSVKCSCGLLSGSSNKSQDKFVKEALGRDENRRKLVLMPPLPNFTSKPNPLAYCLKPTYLFNPAEQFSYPMATVRCPSCKSYGTLTKKEFSALRHVHSISEDCYFCSIVYACSSCKQSFNASDEAYRLFSPDLYLAYSVVLFNRSALHRDLFALAFDLICSKTSSMASILAETIQKRRTGAYLRSVALYHAHCR